MNSFGEILKNKILISKLVMLMEETYQKWLMFLDNKSPSLKIKILQNH